MSYLKESNQHELDICNQSNINWKDRALALNDAVELFRGKWRFYILKNLATGPLCFTDLQLKTKISPKVLTHELKELERNLLITRTVKNSKPVTVEYEVTDYAREIRQVMDALIIFGEKHRAKIKAQLTARGLL